MAISEKRIKILTSSEITDLFEPLVFNIQDQRFFFSLNDIEVKEYLKIRDRSLRCMFVVLLGYTTLQDMVIDVLIEERDRIDRVMKRCLSDLTRVRLRKMWGKLMQPSKKYTRS